MIDRNHPAVLAALHDETRYTRTRIDPYPDECLVEVPAALTAALPHLTADDLRDTPAGRALMAEGWDRGAADNERGWIHIYDGHDVDPDDPLAECQTCGTPNPYLNGDPR